jgi:hypothetical protein
MSHSVIKVKCLKCKTIIYINKKASAENDRISKPGLPDSGHANAHNSSPDMTYEVANVPKKEMESAIEGLNDAKKMTQYDGKKKAEFIIVKPANESRQYSFLKKLLWLLPVPIVIAICFIFISNKGNSYVLNENSPAILPLKKEIQELRAEIRALNQKQYFILAGPKRYEIIKGINEIESLSGDQKKEYDKYNEIQSVHKYLDSVIISRLSLIRDSYPPPSSYLKTVISDTSTVCSITKEYIHQGENKSKWPSKETCLRRLVDKLNPYNYLTGSEKDILKQFFIEAETIYALEYQKWTKYTKMRDNYENMKNEEKEIDHKLQKIDEKITELSDNIRKIEHNISIKTGEKKPQTINDYAILFDASSDTSYMSRPPLDEVSEMDEFFFWNGTLAMKEGNTYIILDAARHPLRSVMTYPFEPSPDKIDIEGFAINNVKKKFAELTGGSRVYVVGKYNGNIEIVLASGQEKVIPMLSDCIVADVKYN